MAVSAGFVVQRPDPETAAALASEAKEKAEQCDDAQAIELIEQAIRLDSIAALNEFHAIRAQFYAALGQDGPERALDEYNHANRLEKAGRYRDAEVVYKEAVTLDPGFLWPPNNLAWRLATTEKSSVRDGKASVKYATEVCEKSNWSCWAFLETLAAAYAESGDFDRAIGWQKASLGLAPTHHRGDAHIMLRHFESRRPYIDEGMPPAAGGRVTEEGHVLSPDQITIEWLRDAFAREDLEAQLDDDGDLIVNLGGLTTQVRVLEHPKSIHLFAVGRPSKQASFEACLQFVNRFNTQARVAKAFILDDRRTVFEYEIGATTAITPASIVASAVFFSGTVICGIREHDSEDLFSSDDEETDSSGEDEPAGSAPTLPVSPNAALVVATDAESATKQMGGELRSANELQASAMSLEAGQACRLVNAGAEHEDFRFRLLPGMNATIEIGKIAEQREVAS